MRDGAEFNQNSIINIEINNQNVNLSKPAIMIDGHVLIPINDVFKELGATIEWEIGDEYEYTDVNIELNELKLLLSINYKSLGILDKEGDYNHRANLRFEKLNVPVQRINDEAYISISVFDHIRTVDMKWQENTHTVSLVYNIISRLNGVWVDENFVNSIDTDGIVKNGKPIMFSISNGKMEYILSQEPIVSHPLEVIGSSECQIEILPIFDDHVSDGYPDTNPKIVIDNTDEIQMIKYISNGREHTLVRFSNYDMMVRYLTGEIVYGDFYISENSPTSYNVDTILVKESFMINEDMIVMRTYDGELETYIFDGCGTWLLNLYEITDDNKKGRLKYELSGNYVD